MGCFLNKIFNPETLLTETPIEYGRLSLKLIPVLFSCFPVVSRHIPFEEYKILQAALEWGGMSMT